MSVDTTTMPDAALDGELTTLDGEAGGQTATALDTGTEVTFASLELPAPLLSVLNEAGVFTAFPIQAAAIPDALVGRDVLGRGRTGSGKTLAFGLPTLARLEGLRAKPRRPLALVLVPTRELAMQVEEALRPYARAMHLRIRSVYGGAPMRKQIDGLRYGVEMLVATPGRLSDLIERGECELDEVDVAILDEADQMCDMGFLPHVCELMDQVAQGGQRLLFSATLDGAVDEIVKKYMNDPIVHEVDPQAGVVSTMSHHLLMVTPQHKSKVAAQIAGRHALETGASAARSIFFVRTQMAVDRVTEQLRERGLPAAGLHGGMTQVARSKTLEDFKEGRTPVLIATDVAARGIHVDGIDLVVHLDPPRDSKDYLHRAGRTARAGQTGIVASLILPKQRKQAQRLMDEAGVTAQELDAAPLGAGNRWESAGAAMAELTGAREVPEPGDVPVFTMPVRERFSRPGDRRDGGGRYGRDERPGRDGSFDRRGRDGGWRGAERRDADRYGRDRYGRGEQRDERGGAAPRREFERGGFGRGTAERGGFDRSGATERTGAERGGFERRDAERFPRGERRDGSFADRDRRDSDGRGFEGRRFEERRFDNRGSESRGFQARGTENRTGDRPGFEGRPARRFDARPEARGADAGRDRARDERGGGQGFRSGGRSADRFGRGDRLESGDRRPAGARPRQDRERGAGWHQNRDGEAR